MAVTFDAASSAATASGVPATSKTVTFTVAANADSVLYAWGSTSDGTTTLTATWNGVSMTALGLIHTNNQAGFGFGRLFRLNSPASGSHDLVLSSTNSSDLTIHGLSLFNVNLGTPNDTPTSTFGNGTTLSGTETSVPTGAMAAFFGCHGAAMAGANQTQRTIQNIDNLSSCGNAAVQTADGAGSNITGTWTAADVWGMLTITVNATGGDTGFNLRDLRAPGRRAPSTMRPPWPQVPVAEPVSVWMPDNIYPRVRRPVRVARGRHVSPMPGQVAPPVNPPYATAGIQHRLWPVLLRRGRLVSPVPPQFNPPIVLTGNQHRLWPGWVRRGRAVAPVPPQFNPPLVLSPHGQGRRLRGWPLRRGRAVTPAPAQLAPSAQVQSYRRRPVLLRPGRQATVPPAQVAAPTNPPYATAGIQHRIWPTLLRRGRLVMPVLLPCPEVSVRLLDHNYDNTDRLVGNNYTTGTVTPSSNAFLSIFLTSYGATPPDGPVITVTGLSLTWAVESAQSDGGSWTGMATAQCGPQPGSGILTLTQAGNAIGCAWAVIETINTNPDQPIAQLVVGGGPADTNPSTTGTINLADLHSPSSTRNRLVAWYMHRADDVNMTERAGWIELVDDHTTGPARGHELQWRSDAVETTSSCTWATSVRWQGIAVEYNAVICAQLVPLAMLRSRLKPMALRRGRQVTPVPLQIIPPVNPPFATAGQQHRLWPGWLRRSRAVTPTPPQQNPPIVVPVRRPRRDVLLRRLGRAVTPVPAQVNPPIVVPVRRPRRDVLLRRRGGTASVPPTQAAAPPPPLPPRALRQAGARWLARNRTRRFLNIFVNTISPPTVVTRAWGDVRPVLNVDGQTTTLLTAEADVVVVRNVAGAISMTIGAHGEILPLRDADGEVT